MKVPTIVAVMVLGAASMMAQAAAAGTAAAPDASKPAEHAACKREMAKNGTKKACHCMKNKDGKMACPHMKKQAETKS